MTYRQSLFEKVVGMSNILDKELERRKPAKRPHRKVVGAAVMDSKLLVKVIKREKAVTGIKALLVLPVAAFHLAIVAGCVGTDELVADTQLSGGGFKESRQVPFTVGETIGELKSVVGLDTLHPDAPAGIPLYQLFEEISGGIGALLGVCSQEAQTGKFIYGSVLEQSQLRVCNTPAGYHLHIHLDPLAGIGHLLIGLWGIGLFLLFLRKHPQLAHDTKQALGPAGIADLFQTVPQFDQPKIGVAAAHIPDLF